MHGNDREAGPSAAGNRTYSVRPTDRPPELQGQWDGPVWGAADRLDVGHFRPEGSSHHPVTHCKLLHDAARLYGLFRVRDRYVRCLHREFQGEVYKDSCVEVFVQPKPGGGYFNLEFNCGGAVRASYVTDPTRVDGALKAFVPLTAEQGALVDVFHSLPARIDPETDEPVTWYLEFSLPFALLESYVGPVGKLAGQVWRANFFKCGDATSHPHWAAWAPLSQRNFHTPESFGRLFFL